MKASIDESLDGSENILLTHGFQEDIEEKARSQLQYSERRRKRPGWLCLLRWLVTLALVAWGAISLAIQSLQALNQARSCSCGTSISEARARKCVFDPLVPAWVPPHCRDDELTEEFRHQGPAENGGLWPYYSALTNGTHLTEAEVAALADVADATFYSTHEFHVTDCLYSWLKMMRGQKRWLVEPRRTRGQFHVRHCHSVVLNPVTMDKIDEGIPAGLFSLNADLVKPEKTQYHVHPGR